MEITAYTSTGCYYCIQLKELFRRANLEYKALECNDTSEELQENWDFLKKNYPDVHSFPFVVIDGEVIGGIVETAKYLINKGLISPPRKNG